MPSILIPALPCLSHLLRPRRLPGLAVRASLIGALAALVGACTPLPVQDAARQGPCPSNLSPADNTRLAGIDQMVADGKHYAALAQLDALGATSPHAQLTRAEALRRIDRLHDARQIYLSLQGGCLEGQVQHGLGLVAAKEGRQADSLAHLSRARQALPTDLRIRNDLGYAQLLAGQLDAAQFEFLTVLDLSPGDIKASRNLVLLTWRQGQTDKAQALARQFGLDAPTVDKLRAIAQDLGAAQSVQSTVMALPAPQPGLADATSAPLAPIPNTPPNAPTP